MIRTLCQISAFPPRGIWLNSYDLLIPWVGLEAFGKASFRSTAPLDRPLESIMVGQMYGDSLDVSTILKYQDVEAAKYRLALGTTNYKENLKFFERGIDAKEWPAFKLNNPERLMRTVLDQRKDVAFQLKDDLIFVHSSKEIPTDPTLLDDAKKGFLGIDLSIPPLLHQLRDRPSYWLFGVFETKLYKDREDKKRDERQSKAKAS